MLNQHLVDQFLCNRRLPLEEVYTLDEIEDLQTVPAGEVNEYLWNVDSRRRPDECLPQSRVRM